MTPLLFCLRRERVFRGIKREKLKAAFPRYVFLKNDEERWREVRGIVGVSGYLEYYEKIKLDGEDGGIRIIEEVRKEETFIEGDSVWILGNSVVGGKYGKFVKDDGEDAEVLVDVMGRYMPFSVKLNDLVLARGKRRKRGKRQDRSR